MPDSPFSDAFDEGKFYTQSSDKHHHSERANFRVPGDWLHFASMVANSPKCPEYETISDIMRDGFAKALAVAIERVNDPEVAARWSAQMGIAELERRKAQDAAEEFLVDLWGDRLRENHGFTEEEWERDLASISHPDHREAMTRLGDRYFS